MTRRTEVQRTLGALIRKQDRNRDERGNVLDPEMERVLVSSIARYESELTAIQTRQADVLRRGSTTIDILSTLRP